MSDVLIWRLEWYNINMLYVELWDKFVSLKKINFALEMKSNSLRTKFTFEIYLFKTVMKFNTS